MWIDALIHLFTVIRWNQLWVELPFSMINLVLGWFFSWVSVSNRDSLPNYPSKKISRHPAFHDTGLSWVDFRYDCGVFTCFFADCFSAGKNLSFEQEDMPTLRMRTKGWIDQGSIWYLMWYPKKLGRQTSCGAGSYFMKLKFWKVRPSVLWMKSCKC